MPTNSSRNCVRAAAGRLRGRRPSADAAPGRATTTATTSSPASSAGTFAHHARGPCTHAYSCRGIAPGAVAALLGVGEHRIRHRRRRPREPDFPHRPPAAARDVGCLAPWWGEIPLNGRGADFLAEVERVRRTTIVRRHEAQWTSACCPAQPGHRHATALVRAFAAISRPSTPSCTVSAAGAQYERSAAGRRSQRVARRRRRPGPRGRHRRRPGRPVTRACVVELVFTRHPTETVRRSLLARGVPLVRALLADLDRTRTPAERRADTERMRTALTAAWQTSDKRARAPEPWRTGPSTSPTTWSMCCMRWCPEFTTRLRRRAAEVGLGAPLPPPLLHFGTWVIGDMDGNPTSAPTPSPAHAGCAVTSCSAPPQRAHLGLRSLFQPVALARGGGRRRRRRARRRTYRAPCCPMRSTTRRHDAEGMPTGSCSVWWLRARPPPRANAAMATLTPRNFAPTSPSSPTSLVAHGGAHRWRGRRAAPAMRIDTLRFPSCRARPAPGLAQHDVALAALLADHDWPQRPAAERARACARCSTARRWRKPARPTAATWQSFRTAHAARLRFGAQAFGPLHHQHEPQRGRRPGRAGAGIGSPAAWTRTAACRWTWRRCSRPSPTSMRARGVICRTLRRTTLSRPPRRARRPPAG